MEGNTGMDSIAPPCGWRSHLIRVLLLVAVGAQPGACLHLLTDLLQLPTVPNEEQNEDQSRMVKVKREQPSENTLRHSSMHQLARWLAGERRFWEERILT